MRLQVNRETLTSNSTIGSLYVDDLFYCYTLEPPKREDKPCSIPEGSYELTIRLSPRFKRLMPHIESVPGFDGILIHWGNYPKDTDGCALVGYGRGVDVVWESKDAFNTLFNRLLAWAESNGGETDGVYKCGTITYLDPHPAPVACDLDGEVSGAGG